MVYKATKDQVKRSRKVVNHVRSFYDKCSSQQLISLWSVYGDYGKPPYKSPRRVMQYPLNKHWIEHHITNDYNMEVERVIQYCGKDVHVCFEMALRYLVVFELQILIDTGLWIGVFGTDKISDELLDNDIIGHDEIQL